MIRQGNQTFWDAVIPKIEEYFDKNTAAEKKAMDMIFGNMLEGKFDPEQAAELVFKNFKKMEKTIGVISAFIPNKDAIADTKERIIRNIAKAKFADFINNKFSEIEAKTPDDLLKSGAAQTKLLAEQAQKIKEFTKKLFEKAGIENSEDTALTIIDAPYRRAVTEYVILSQSNHAIKGEIPDGKKAELEPSFVEAQERFDKRFKHQSRVYSKLDKEHYEGQYEIHTNNIQNTTSGKWSNPMKSAIEYDIKDPQDLEIMTKNMLDGAIKAQAAQWIELHNTQLANGSKIIATAAHRIVHRLDYEAKEVLKPNYRAYHFDELKIRNPKMDLVRGV